MNHNVIFDTLVNHQTKDYERVEDIRRGLSEEEEALIRSQAIVMIDRNQGRQHIVMKVLKRFKRCINV